MRVRPPAPTRVRPSESGLYHAPNVRSDIGTVALDGREISSKVARVLGSDINAEARNTELRRHFVVRSLQYVDYRDFEVAVRVLTRLFRGIQIARIARIRDNYEVLSFPPG